MRVPSWLSCYLLECHVRDVRAVTGVLEGETAKVPVRVDVKQGVFVELTSLGNLRRAELYVKSLGVLKVGDFHD
jgi:hypothetical protein